MHEHSQIPATGLGQAQATPNPEHSTAHPADANVPAKNTNGAMFDVSRDDSYNFSGLRKLQDASKFDKARFSFRLYKR